MSPRTREAIADDDDPTTLSADARACLEGALRRIERTAEALRERVPASPEARALVAMIGDLREAHSLVRVLVEAR